MKGTGKARDVDVRNANEMRTVEEAKRRLIGYYFRQYRGQQIVQKCPTKWKDTPARKAAREKFVAKYAGKRKG